MSRCTRLPGLDPQDDVKHGSLVRPHPPTALLYDVSTTPGGAGKASINQRWQQKKETSGRWLGLDALIILSRHDWYERAGGKQSKRRKESLVYFVLFIFYTFSHPYSTAHFNILEVNGEDVTGRVFTKVTGPHSNTRRLPLVSSTRREVVVGAFHTSNAPV